MVDLDEGTATVMAAAIAAIVAALSWLGRSAIAALVWYYARRTREIEMMTALAAEIETSVGSLVAYAEQSTAERIKSEMAGQPDYRIFIPLDRDYFVFERVKSDISILPEASIRQVVKFYDGIGAFDTLLASFQENRFESFPPGRRVTYLDHMVQAAAATMADGRAAIDVLEAERTRLRRPQRFVVLLVVLTALLVVATIVAAIAGWLRYVGLF